MRENRSGGTSERIAIFPSIWRNSTSPTLEKAEGELEALRADEIGTPSFTLFQREPRRKVGLRKERLYDGRKGKTSIRCAQTGGRENRQYNVANLEKRDSLLRWKKEGLFSRNKKEEVRGV